MAGSQAFGGDRGFEGSELAPASFTESSQTEPRASDRPAPEEAMDPGRHRRRPAHAASTVGAVCRRLGLGRLADLERRPPIVRYERANAGELIHLDTKKLARIERVGHRIHGDRRQTVEGAGWEYLHVCIDDASRVAYAEVLADEKGVTCTGFVRRAVAWFKERGIPVQRVMPDNGGRVPLEDVPSPRPKPGAPAPSYAPLHAPHEREGRTLHPDLQARMGLCPPLRPLP